MILTECSYILADNRWSQARARGGEWYSLSALILLPSQVVSPGIDALKCMQLLCVEHLLALHVQVQVTVSCQPLLPVHLQIHRSLTSGHLQTHRPHVTSFCTSTDTRHFFLYTYRHTGHTSLLSVHLQTHRSHVTSFCTPTDTQVTCHFFLYTYRHTGHMSPLSVHLQTHRSHVTSFCAPTDTQVTCHFFLCTYKHTGHRSLLSVHLQTHVTSSCKPTDTQVTHHFIVFNKSSFLNKP